MPEINIFAENIHESKDVDEKNAIEVAKKILSHYLEEKEIFEDSCFFNETFKCISFDILFCDSTKTHEINKDYRNKDYEADIITFAIFADSEEKFIFDNEINLGEIIISLDKVEKNAQEKGVETVQELNFLISHGIMHLLGFDHRDEKEYNFIIQAQNSALKKLS